MPAWIRIRFVCLTKQTGVEVWEAVPEPFGTQFESLPFPRLPQCPAGQRNGKRTKSEPTGRNFGRMTVLLEHFRCYNEMKPL